MDLSGELRAGAEALGLELQQSQFDQLIEYLYLLDKWNRVYNLTAIRELPKMLTHHLLDSLAISTALEACNKALDVGSGAGLPGVPLAIAMPESIWVLLDSNGRKTRFIRQAVAHCGLRNVQVVQSRVQDYHAPDSFDFIISRAFASLGGFCDAVVHLMAPDTRLITMKSGMQPAEADGLDRDRFEFEERYLQVPGVRETRSLVKVTRV